MFQNVLYLCMYLLFLEIIFIVCAYVYVCIWSCMHSFVEKSHLHMSACGYGGHELTSGAILSCSLPHFLRQVLSVNMKLTDSAGLCGQLAPEFLLSLLP